MNIPRLSGRLDCMIYRRKLELEIEEIRPELDIIRNAARELRSSSGFKRVLQVLSLSLSLDNKKLNQTIRPFWQLVMH